MSAGAIRAGVVIFVIGLLFIWLIGPIGNACPDVDKLPSGSEGSSAPSFAPPLTRTCTYSTPDGTQARRRYVPVLDVVALLFVAGLVGGAIGLARAGRGTSARAREPERAPGPPRVADEDDTRHERDTHQRERARQERQERRRG